MFSLFKKKPLYTIYLSQETGVPPIPVFDKKIIIGRSAQHQLAIPDNSISRNHLEVQFREKKIFIKDMGTSNGTKINEQNIPPQLEVEYYPGQIIILGKCSIQITFALHEDKK